MGCMLNFRKRNPRKQNETENFSIIRMDGGTLSRKLFYYGKEKYMILLVVDTQKGCFDASLYAFDTVRKNIKQLITTAREASQRAHSITGRLRIQSILIRYLNL